MSLMGLLSQMLNEIWWLETIGGHHWMARRVPDDAYVTNPNQLGSDYFEFDNPEHFPLSSKSQKLYRGKPSQSELLR